MGHLTRIANTIVHNLEKGPVHTQISSLITGAYRHVHVSSGVEKPQQTITFAAGILFSKYFPSSLVAVELPEECRGRWENFVNQTLSETNRKNTIDLVSTLKIVYNSCM